MYQEEREQTHLKNIPEGVRAGRTFRAARQLVAMVLALRPRQWIKNVFVFSPLIFAGRLGNAESLIASVRVCLLFCLAASVVYLFNDLVDREVDRLHPANCKRPIASGTLSVPMAVVELVVLSLILAGFLVYETLPVAGLLAGYLVLNVAYTLHLQRMAILGAMVVAAGFVIRTLVGGEAIGVEVTPWLIGCTFLLCLFASLGKKRSELGTAAPAPQKWIVRLMALSMASCAVCYVVYTVFSETGVINRGLVVSIPFALYCLLRFWKWAQRGEIVDVTDILFKDLRFLVAGLCWLVSVTFSLYYA